MQTDRHSATQLLYHAAGEPAWDHVARYSGPCWLCAGETAWGRPAILPETFMDYDKARCPSSGHICVACWFCMAEASSVLAERVGKVKPQRMRNYSHFVLHGEWLPLSKGDKRRMYEVLLQEPELAVIAVSGQKHLIFRAQPGRWQVEEQAIRPEVDGLIWLVEAVQELYDGGFLKSEIETGHYATWRIVQFGDARWCATEMMLRPTRGSALFELAVFLAQKSEGEDGQGEDTGNGVGGGLGAVAGDGPELQAPLCAGDLGPVSGPPAGRGDGHEQPGHIRQLGLL